MPRFKTDLVKRTSHIVLSAWLAILLLFGGTAKEFIHLFSGHEDTIHCNIVHDGLVIEPEHHHCSFLQFSLTSFINDVQAPFVPVHTVVYTHQYDEVLPVSIYGCKQVVTSLRGPPVV